MIIEAIRIYLNRYKGFRRVLGLVRLVKEFSKIQRFVRDANKFKHLGGEIDRISIHLNEDREPAGNLSGQYFWQDLIVAQWVLKQEKKTIVDIGSRIDGYVSNVAASRKLAVIDIRPIETQIPNVEFIQADILNYRNKRRFEIVSSLHTIEHIGLGRYGDQINPLGHTEAFNALAELVAQGGYLVVSFPISTRTEVEFNGQRKIGFREPLDWARRCGFELIQFLHLDSNEAVNEYLIENELKEFKPESGTLGIYFFKKILS